MHLTYDARLNVAYLRLREKTAQVQTIRVSEEVNVDIAPDGTVYGVEFLNANSQLQDDGGRLVYRDEVSGEQREIHLSR